MIKAKWHAVTGNGSAESDFEEAVAAVLGREGGKLGDFVHLK